MRRLAITAILVAVSGGASAQSADDCYQATLRTDDREIIRICSAALQSANLDDRTRSITVSNRGLGYLRDKQYDKAILDFSDALVVDGKNPFPFNFRGEAWRELNNFERAFADFDQALRIDPDFTGAMYNRGLTFERQGATAAARAEYRRAIATKGDRALDTWARDRAHERLTALGDGPQRQEPPRKEPQRQDPPRYDVDKIDGGSDRERR